MANKNAAAIDNSNPETLEEFKGWEEEQISFPPYWEAAIGKWFAGLVTDLDSRDPNFARYIVEAIKPINCKIGSKKKGDAEEVTVKPGEFFTLSAYSGLPLDRYIGLKVLVRCTGTRDTGKPQPMLTFKLSVSPEDKALLMADQKRLAAESIRRFREGQSVRQLGQGSNGPAVTVENAPFLNPFMEG